MSSSIRDAFSGFGWDLLDEIRSSFQEKLDDEAFEERVIGIENATAAMLEVDEEKIIQMLQKYWDLRLSEAKEFIRRQKKMLQR